MLIDDHYRQCVCFLGVKELNDAGIMEWKARATAFFMVMQLNDTEWIHYLATARHIIVRTRPTEFSK
jgi:hypothetical protein